MKYLLAILILYLVIVNVLPQDLVKTQDEWVDVGYVKIKKSTSEVVDISDELQVKVIRWKLFGILPRYVLGIKIVWLHVLFFSIFSIALICKIYKYYKNKYLDYEEIHFTG